MNIRNFTDQLKGSYIFKYIILYYTIESPSFQFALLSFQLCNSWHEVKNAQSEGYFGPRFEQLIISRLRI
jgi:hypothetical protein